MRKQMTEMDIKLGNILQQLRIGAGISRQTLSDRIEITHQQLAKYERGINRLSAARLWEFSRIFNVPVGYFFETQALEISKGDKISRQATKHFLQLPSMKDKNMVNELIKRLVRCNK